MKSHGSMNRVYRLIWSEVLNGWVAVAESGRGRGKGASRKLIAATLSLSAAFAQAAPVGGQVVSGTGSVTQSGTTTTIQQASQNLSLNWQSFNIAPQETVNFVQPSAAAIAVNRIFDTSGTQILGRLNANGQVYLINPNGILFGQGAQVNVGGLVASTLDLNDASLSGNARAFSGNGTGSVVNQGTINAAKGGYVALLGNTVSNQGTITAPQGAAALGAGSAATLTFQNNSLVQMQVDQSVLNSLAENGGLIRADGGQVIMNAGAKNALLASVVNNTGVIEARTVENHAGSIILLGGMTAGTVNVGGTLDASAPNGGNGGFIETSAAQVRVADDAKVTTAAPQGKAGTWLIDPTDYTIAAVDPNNGSSYMSNAALSTSLDSNNVTIETLPEGAGNGDIFVNGAVTWSANNTLTLNAIRNVNVNAAINNTGTGGIILNSVAGQTALSQPVNTGGTLEVTTGTGLSLAANLTGDNVTLTHSGALTRTGGTISANTLTLAGAGSVGTSGANLRTAAPALILSKSSGDTFVTTTGALSLQGNTGTGALNVISAGAITQGGTSLVVGGTTALDAGANAITLANTSNNFTGAVSLNTTDNISIADTNAIILGTVVAGGSLMVSARGAVTQSGVLTVGDALTVSAANQSITLNEYNAVTGPVNLTGRITQFTNTNILDTTVILNTTGATTLTVNDTWDPSSVAVSGTANTLTVNASGGISINQNLTTTGVTTLNAIGTLTVAAGKTLSTQNSALNITAADIDLAGSLNSGGGLTSITASLNQPLTLGSQFGLTLSSAELGRITSFGGLNLATTGTADITVNSPISWTRDYALTLSSGRNITVNANSPLTTTSGGYPVVTLKAANNVAINAPLSSNSGAGLHVTLTADADGDGAGNINFGAAGQITTNGGNFYAGEMTGGSFTKKGQNLTMASGSFIDVAYGALEINVNGAVTLAARSLRAAESDNLFINVVAGSIATTNTVATVPDIVTRRYITGLSAGTIGSANRPIKISAGDTAAGNVLSIVNTAGSSYVNQVENQAFADINLTIGSQANSIQNVQIMSDAGGDGTTGTGHVILQTDGAGVLNIATDNIKTAGGPGVNATHVSVTAPNMTFADGSVNTGTASFTASASGTMRSIQVNGIGDISAPTVSLNGPTIGTSTNPLELGIGGIGSTLNVNNTGGSTFIKSVNNDFTNIFLTNVQTAGTHAILFSGGDHIDYTTNGTDVFLPMISGGASDGVTFGSTTGIDVTRRNRNVTLTAASGNMIFDDNSVNTGFGSFTAQIPINNPDGVIAALTDYDPDAPEAQITAGNVTFNIFNSGTPAASTIGADGKDIQIAQGTDASNNTLTVNTQQGNVTIRELTLNHFKTLNVILNSPSAAQNVVIDLNGADDVNFSDSGSLVSIDATKVNLSANNRNWNLSTPVRSVQIDGVSLGSGSYTVNAGNNLSLNADVMTNGGAISLTTDDDHNWGGLSTGIHLLRSVRIDSNADDTGNTASTGASGAITMNGTVLSSTLGSSRTLTVDSSSSTASGGQINMNSGASDRNPAGTFVGGFLTGLTFTAKGSTDTNDGAIWLNGSGRNYYLNGNFSSTGRSSFYPIIIDTEQGNLANGGNITFSGQDLTSHPYYPLVFNTATTAAGKSGGNVNLSGTFSHSTLEAAEVTVNTVGGAGGTSGSISLPAVTTTAPGDAYSGIQSYTGGIITLNGNLTSNQGAVILNGDTRLAANVIIDTWQYRNDIQTGTAGTVTIGGVGISALGAGRNLTIDTSTNTGTAYFDDVNTPSSTAPFAHSGGNVSIVTGNAGGAYVNTLTVNTTKGGTHNTVVGVPNGTIALNTVGTEGSQTYTGGATTVSGSLTTNGGSIGLAGVDSLALSGAAVTFDTDRVGGTSNAGALDLGARTLNGAHAVTIDTTADGGGAGANLTLSSVGAVTPLSSLNVAAAVLSVNATGVKASGDITLEARGASSDLTLNSTVASTSGNIALVAGRNFINNIGTTALNAGSGRWLVYSTSPAGSTENGLTAAAGSTLPRLYNKTFASNAPATITAGNHLIYSTQPTLTVTAGNQTRVYGDANAAFTATTTGFVIDDGVTDTLTTAGLTGAAALSSTADATTGVGSADITAAVGGLVSSAGYNFGFVDGTLTINQRPITLTAPSVTKTYDGGLAYTTLAGDLTALAALLVGGDTVSAATIAYTNANAGAGNKTVNLNAATISDGNSGNNYSVTLAGNSNSTINRYAVSMTGTRAYDGSADVASGIFTLGALAGTETLTLSGSGTVASRNVGNGKTVITTGLALNDVVGTGGLASNYTFAGGTQTANITARAVTLTAPTVSKTYNGDLTYITVAGDLTALAAPLVGGDTVSAATIAYTNANAGAGNKTVNLNAATISDGNSGNNYSVTLAGNSTSTISQRPITLSADAKAKVYGNTDPALTYQITAGNLIGSDSLSGALTRSAGENVGSYTIDAAALANGNYLITANNGALTISQRPITLTADAKAKVYGNTDPALTYQVSSGSLVGSDTFTGVLTRSAGENVGSYVIDASALANGNYLITANNGALTISQRPISVTADAKAKTYGNTDPALTYQVTTGSLVTGDSLSGALTRSAGENVGSYTINAAALANGNYLITANNGALAINKAHLTVTADNKSRLYGEVNPTLSTTVSGFVNGETASTAAGFAGAGSATTLAGLTTGVGTALITAGAGNLTASNYDFTNLVDGTLTINSAALTLQPASPPAPVLNAMAQLQSEALFYRMNIEPQTLNLSPTLTVTQSSGTGSAASSPESVNPAAGSTRMNVNTLMNVNTIVMGPSLQIMNIGATGTTLQIVNGGMRLPDTLANEN